MSIGNYGDYLGIIRGYYMGDYKVNIVNLNVTNNYVELTIELEGTKNFSYREIQLGFNGKGITEILRWI